MLQALCHVLLLSLLFVCVSSVDIEFPRCSCQADGLLSGETIQQIQRLGDFLIATAYFSIPLELLYFLSCSSVFPFKWVLFQFVAFIVLCGMSHLLTVFTYEPHSFLLTLAITVSKFLTALVSFATAITLLTLIPQLLRVKVRENFLRMKAQELDREVGMMKRQEEASWHVRMLTQEIRRSLDRHTILYTTLIELSKTLSLQNCAVWMPKEDKMMINLTHELRQRSLSDLGSPSIPVNDPDIVEIKETNGTKVLRPDSKLGPTSSGRISDYGAVAAIRMPLLKVSDFKRGTPEVIETGYAILVLVLPKDGNREWSNHELEIVEVVADQVAVALSHASVLEESQMMREKLVEQNRALQQAKTNAMTASMARCTFQKVMSQGMSSPVHSILGLLSMIQQESLVPEQKLIVDAIIKTGLVVSASINDIMQSPDYGTQSLALEVRSFQMHDMIKEALSVARCLCDFKGFGFSIQIDNAIPDRVIGDEKRILQVILHMLGNLLSVWDKGFVLFVVHCDSEPGDRHDQRLFPWRSNLYDGYANVRFQITIRDNNETPDMCCHHSGRPKSGNIEMGLSFSMCRRLVQMMQGNIWTVTNSQGLSDSMTLLLRFQLLSSGHVSEPGGSLDRHQQPLSHLFKGLKVLLADEDDTNRAVNLKLLERLGCHVYPVSSGSQCLSSLSSSSTFDLVVLDLDMHEIDGFDLASHMRKFRSEASPLIVALAASSREKTWEKCLQYGMHGLIQKPITLRGVADELRRVLHNT